MAELIRLDELHIDRDRESDEIIAEALPVVVPVAGRIEDPRLEATNRMMRLQEIVADLRVIDDGTVTTRKLHRMGGMLAA